ncbi:MAG: DnaJ domain-containing protein [Deltaproteobacteria bacterium]|nr:DnaJ domain-containing protein [Deltaproteobacteria bacterium]
MKDYYHILEVKRTASAEEIKRSYRRLAFACHPDKNPGDLAAEERFKEVSEAYAVLMDPDKRRRYDIARAAGLSADHPFIQEDVLKDLFSDPRMSKMFSDMLADFERAGYRTDLQFFDRVFFGGRGFLYGGMLVLYPLASAWTQAFLARRGKGVKMLAKLGSKVADVLLGPATKKQPGDLFYHLHLSPEQAAEGSRVEVTVDAGGKTERLKVSVPAGVKPGTRLRIRRRGKAAEGDERGDLYLLVKVSG